MFKLKNEALVRGLLLAGLTVVLVGCGGGGGGDGGVPGGPAPGTGTTPGTGGEVEAEPSVTLALTDWQSGTTSNSLSIEQPLRATAMVVDAAGKAVPNAVVSFTTDSATLVALIPDVGTALTDASGKASIQLVPKSLTSAGAGRLTAKTEVDGKEASKSTGFSVNAPAVGLANMRVGQSPLSPYGTTGVSVDVTGVARTVPVTVNFSSTCAGQGKASLTSSTVSVAGVATANYEDKGCARTDTITDTITASVAGTTISTSTSLQVDAPGIASIQFVSATPETIVLKGTGSTGFQESALVRFKVVDSNNEPIPNAQVTFDLSTRTGGILLDTSSAAVTKFTDVNGEAQVSVQAGSNPTPVWVTAQVSAGGVTFNTQSVKLTVSTGRPAQDRMSLSVETPNIEGWDLNGVETQVSTFASDRLGNPVPDGTAVNFVASGGQIQPSCTTTNGRCSVKFTSANPRPVGNTEPSVVAVSRGRVAILAYALGEESFLDTSGNGRYDSGEPFNDLGNVYLDRNFNRTFDAASEEAVVYDATKRSACVTGMSNSPYAPSQAGTCDGVWGQAHVRQANTIVLSGSTASASRFRPMPGSSDVRTFSMGGVCTATMSFYLFDENRNPMPAGTRIYMSSAPVTPGGIFDENIPAGFGDGTGVSSQVVPRSSAPGGTLHALVLDRIETEKCEQAPTRSFPLAVQTPTGEVTTITFTITK